MNQNAELLNFIYQNSEMGVETLNQIIEIVENPSLAKQLESQRSSYKEIHQKSKEMLNENGYDEKAISTLEKISAYIMINLKTLTDKSDTHISEMLIQGSNMGIIDAAKKSMNTKTVQKKISFLS